MGNLTFYVRFTAISSVSSIVTLLREARSVTGWRSRERLVIDQAIALTK